jgi:hypothetical protein
MRHDEDLTVRSGICQNGSMPFVGPREDEADTSPQCFVIMPISTPASVLATYQGDALHFQHMYESLFKPAIEAAGYVPRFPRTQGSAVIQADIITRLNEADLVLCDISTLNANVFFELGIRTALDLPVCLVRDDQTDTLPFDTSLVNTLTYKAALNA